MTTNISDPSREVRLPSDVIHVKTDDVIKVEDKTKKGIDWGTGVIIPIAIALLGLLQYCDTKTREESDQTIAQIQRYADRASQASSTRQVVLTDYAKSITELVTQRGLDDPQSPTHEQAKNTAKGETLIALRRLDDGGEVEELANRAVKLLVGKKELSDEERDRVIGESLKDFSGANDSGEGKGLLVRFLYESKLIKGEIPRVDLNGANITKVVLTNAPLKEINLKGAWLSGGQLNSVDLNSAKLDEATLIGANLQKANLAGASLEKTDLRNADLEYAILSDATKLTDACYNKNTQLPNNINPKTQGMREIAGDPPFDRSCKDL
jgi:uncharacterized protein YjbI with pentapeptide repeats